jgi:rhomboid family GlyGly-CTERM serine protease
MRLSRFPWATFGFAALSLANWFDPALRQFSLFDRAAVLQGEIWRIWMSSGVHFSASHLGWDLLVFACVGTWAESKWPGPARWLYLAAPAAICAALVAFQPELRYYGGLSGLACALAVFGCLQEAQARRSVAWLAPVALIAVKICWECERGASLFVPLDSAGIYLVPLSHLAGAACAAAWIEMGRTTLQ